MAKFMLLGVAVLLSFTVRCYGADYEAALSGVPIVGAMVSPPAATPKYVETIGKPAASGLPETDLKTWFAPDAKDPLDVATWRAIAAYMSAAGTKDGWAEVCKKAAEAAGAERPAAGLGPLACSSDGTVTGLQRFAVHLLAMRAEVALYLRGVPGSSLGAIQSRQAEVRTMCGVDVVARQGQESPFAAACERALATDYLAGDAAATFAALGTAYDAAGAEIARRDPKTAVEPGYFEPAKQ